LKAVRILRATEAHCVDALALVVRAFVDSASPFHLQEVVPLLAHWDQRTSAAHLFRARPLLRYVNDQLHPGHGRLTVPAVLGAYYPGYPDAPHYPVDRIPADVLTHVFYAFARIDQGRCVVGGNATQHFAELAALKRAYPGRRTLISIGGWGAGGFSDAALTPESRATFVDSCLGQFGDFDGVDLDWEFPVSGGPDHVTHRPEDRRNATLLAVEFRRRLGPERLLTAALPAGRLQSAGPYDPAESFELAVLAGVLDFVNLMTYDFGTAFSPIATFNAPLYEVAEDPLDPALRRWNCVSGAVTYYEAAGVPRDKMVLGVPFYGRGFRVTGAGRAEAGRAEAGGADGGGAGAAGGGGSGPGGGLFQPQTGTVEVGDWRDIQRDLLPDPAWNRYRHPVARSPWLYHVGSQTFVSYEDAESIEERSRFAATHGLRGAFMWQLAGDDDEHTLLAAMARPFSGGPPDPLPS
jgi:chitinase